MLNRQEAEKMVRENILFFWQGMKDTENGGFYGEADFYGRIDKTKDKGCILNSRILWTFSAAYRLFGDESYKAAAKHAKDFLVSAFYDREFGGLYWLTDNSGRPLQTRKQFYNIAFGIYALSEYYLAVKDQSSLELALALFDVTEKYGLDKKDGGYTEACKREWDEIGDFRLSDKEINCPKSMNTNLHIMEAYTTLAHASADERVKDALKKILRVTMDRIVNDRWHFDLFFNMDWKPLSKEVSWGHDIEGSWLLYEAALETGDKSLIGEGKHSALKIADVIYNTALDKKNGGLFSGCNEEGVICSKKEWWPQAEAVAGFYYAYKLSGERKYFDAADGVWNYISNHFTDYANGEWHNELNPGNTPDTSMPKAGFWKCPYHNSRACFEIIKRTD